MEEEKGEGGCVHMTTRQAFFDLNHFFRLKLQEPGRSHRPLHPPTDLDVSAITPDSNHPFLPTLSLPATLKLPRGWRQATKPRLSNTNDPTLRAHALRCLNLEPCGSRSRTEP